LFLSALYSSSSNCFTNFSLIEQWYQVSLAGRILQEMKWLTQK
jgi:hypothetical protein